MGLWQNKRSIFLGVLRGVFLGKVFMRGEGCMWGVRKEMWRMFLGGFEGVKWRRCGVEKRLAELVV